MSDKTTGYAALTLESFVNQVLPHEPEQNRTILRKSLQRTLFNGMFKPFRTKVERTYRTVGHISEAVFTGSKSKAFILKQLKAQPIVGKLLARKEIFDDHEFIVVAHRNEVFMLLDNSATDCGLPQVLRYDTSEQLFVETSEDILEMLLQVRV